MKLSNLILIFVSITSSLSAQEPTNHPESSIVFTIEAPASPFTSEVANQYKGGTCWCMSALSYWEAEGLRLSGKQVNLSERFVLYQTYILKARNYLERDGKAQFGQGGEFFDVQAVVQQFGLMPETAWPWEPAPKIEVLHPQLEAYLGILLKYHDLMGRYPDSWEADFRSILDRHLGRMPHTFQFEGREHTPLSFAQSLNIKNGDYINLMSDTRYSAYTQVVVPMADNWISGTAWNLPFEIFTALPQEVLRQGGTIEWATDVSNPHWKWKMGIAAVHGLDTLALPADERRMLWLKPIAEQRVSADARQLGLQQHSTTDDHGMHIIALVNDPNQQPYYLVKNSWGTDSNECKGYLFVSAQYANLYTTMYSIHKDFLPASVKQQLRRE